MKHLAFLLLFSISMAVMWPVSAKAQIFWEDDFEGPPAPFAVGGSWGPIGSCIESNSDEGCSPHGPIRVTSQAHSGTHSLLSHYTADCGMGPVAPGCGAYIDRDHTSTNAVYMRWWALHIGFTAGDYTGSKQMYNKTLDPQGGMLIFWHVFEGTNHLAAQFTHNGYSQFCPQPPNANFKDEACNLTNNGGDPVNLFDGQWHCIETFIDSGTGGNFDGAVLAWVDGRLQLNYPGLAIKGPGITSRWNHITHYAQHGLGDRYIDQLAVGGSRIGCGAAPPTQTLTVAKLRIPPNTTETSTVTVTQPSNGVISGWGISCGTSATDCAESFLNFTTVTLTATPDSGAVFNGWSGACADRGTNTTCTLTLSAGVAVAASFTLTTRNLTITKAGTGAGHVYDADFNVICSDSCTSYSHDYPLNTSVTIHAWATTPDSWDGYSGSCTGTGENPPSHDCTLTMSSNKAVTVTFTTGATFTLYAKASSQGALSTGTCTTIATACTVARALSLVTAGQTIGLLGTNSATDGLYQGANDMLNLASFAPGKSGTSDTSRITVAAVHDGGVFIDGQFARPTFVVEGHSYWTFQGFDVGNSAGASVIAVNEGSAQSGNLTFQRICASNTRIRGGSGNDNYQVWFIGGVTGPVLVEDSCGFGTGRNILQTFYNYDRVTTGSITIRRWWGRWEGYPYTFTAQSDFCGGPVLQPGYHDQSPYTGYVENVIGTHNAEQILSSDTECYHRDANSLLMGSQHKVTKGVVIYDYANIPQGPGFSYWDANKGQFGIKPDITGSYTYADMFIDGRNYPVQFGPTWVRGASSPNPLSFDRITSLRHPSGAASTWDVAQPSTFTECTTLGNCPNFYTGVAQGTGTVVGARNCFQYLDGTLTSTPLWPWPMDDRIKAALARANAAGTGGTALLGSAGTGYAANTVTSEIVSRYGAVPAACLR